VLVPAYTWISTAAAPVLLGAIPVLVEIDATLTMDPADLESKITPRTRAVVPVHMLNLPADMDRIMDIARRHGLLVVEDACQAVGVTYRSRHLGSIGDAGAFSFNQHKNIRAGEGGAVLVDDERTYVRAAMLHDVGAYTRGRLTHDELPFVGMNLRMPEVSSAVVRPQLRRLHKRMARQADVGTSCLMRWRRVPTSPSAPTMTRRPLWASRCALTTPRPRGTSHRRAA
jgi:dTDP-4-amino-4,6-dideoxygalactose transaminase